MSGSKNGIGKMQEVYTITAIGEPGERVRAMIIGPCLDEHSCMRCGHKWKARYDRMPRVCPGCKSPYWNKPRRKP